MRINILMKAKALVSGYTKRMSSGLVVHVAPHTRNIQLQASLRHNALKDGIRMHRKLANKAKTKKEMRVLLAKARLHANAKGMFIWIKPHLTGHEDKMQIWATYNRKTAPKAILKEYNAFWSKVIDIYKARLGRLEKGIAYDLEQSIRKEKMRPRIMIRKGTSKIIRIKSTFEKGCRYSLEKDDSCGDGEFYLIHGTTGKRYKVRHRKKGDDEETKIKKSWSSKIMSENPGARWVTITDASSPLHGRHILIMPHSNGTASIVWAPEHSGITHKIIQPKSRGERAKQKESSKIRKIKREEENAKRRAEMSDEAVETYQKKQQELKEKVDESKKKLHSLIREKAGIETEVTEKEKQEIEKKIAKLDKKQRNAERLKEFHKIKSAKDKALDQIIDEAKKVLLTGQNEVSDDMPSDKKKIAQAIKEHAEDFLKSWYLIKQNKKELATVNKILNTGKITRAGSDIVGITEITKDEIKDMVEREEAITAEIKAHHDLILNTRGGIDRDGNELTGKAGKGVGSTIMTRSINTGALEAINSITGEMAGTSIITPELIENLGASNVAVLADHYLSEKLGDEYTGKTDKLRNYVETKGNEIAADGVSKGDKYLDYARRVKKFGKGDEMLYGSVLQATAASLAYTNRAYTAYGQAEGSLNMAAEMLYQYDNKKKHISIHASNRPALYTKLKHLGLNKSDVIINRHGHGDYEMRIMPSKFGKLIKEKQVAQFRTMTDEPTPESIKAGAWNEESWLPEGMKTHLPPDKDGNMQKIKPTESQQSAARLLLQQKKVYLNFEAGTGKSYAYILQKAHIEEQTGKKVKTIISMPKKLMRNFVDEVKKFSNYNVVIADSPDKAKRQAAYNSDPNTIVLVNKEKFYHDYDMINEAGFNHVVADEAHRITQRESNKKGSRMSRGLAKIAKKAEYYVAGTGTPTPNDLSELYFHLNIMNPDKYHSQKEFMSKYGHLHKGAGFKEKLAQILNAELSDRVFTAKKKLNTKFFEKVHNVSLSEKQVNEYRKVQKKYLKKRITPMARDFRISKILNDHNHKDNPKYQRMKEVIDEHIATKGESEKVLIYAKNYSTVEEIERFLRANYPGQKSVRFTGQDKGGRSMSQKKIAANKKAYLTDKKVRFAIHTDAGVEGLNLQHTGEKDRPHGATTVIAMASGAHSYATIDQFFSRANRKGANKNVHGHLILTETPHDMNTEERLTEKRNVMGLLQEGEKYDEMGVAAASPPEAFAKSVKIYLKRRMYL